MEISRVAVLGAGAMGSQIAAHLANAGLDVTLFEQTTAGAAAAIDGLRRTRPAALFLDTVARQVMPAALDSLEAIRTADWVIEAVVEDLDIKRGLLARVQPHLSPTAVVSSNTSGIPIGPLAEGLDSGTRSRWLGTHFFNPPRYMHLVELIPTPETNPAIVPGLSAFLDRRLGKGVVIARDRPGFIANRLGMFSALRSIDAMAALGLTVEDVDALTGPIIGRPKSATFRTMDLAGIDIVARVAGDLSARLGEAGRAFVVPPLVAALVRDGAIGVKTGRGFYQRVGSGDDREIQTLDPASMTFRPFRRSTLAGLDAIGAMPDVRSRVRALLQDAGPCGAFTRETLGRTLIYAADVAGEIATSIDDIDRAMRWGFGWEQGPFELWDAVGVDVVLSACAVAAAPPALVLERRVAGADRLRDAPLRPASPEMFAWREPGRRVVRRNPGASLVDFGDGVLGLDLHSKLNTIGGDTLAMIHAGIAESAANFAALVIGSDADLFSAGANLTLLLLEAQDGNWDEVDGMVREFQRATTAIARAPIPVVVAPRGLCLGGGCEIVLHADCVQAGAELYIGLVETSVGLIPAGGGSKVIVQRAQGRPGLDPFDALQQAFAAAALAKASTSAADAVRLGYLRESDGVSMNPDRVLADACALARLRARTYAPRRADPAIPVGGPDAFARLSLGVHLAERAGRASAHDALVGRTLAWVLTGGDIPRAGVLPEARLLDLEREAFLSLCGERRTRDRIAHTLKTGKPLRN